MRVLCPGADPASVSSAEQALRLIERRGTDALGFLQFFNLHRDSEAVRRTALGAQLAGVAAQLLGARRVRLYQDAGEQPPRLALSMWKPLNGGPGGGRPASSPLGFARHCCSCFIICLLQDPIHSLLKP